MSEDKLERLNKRVKRLKNKANDLTLSFEERANARKELMDLEIEIENL